MGNARQKTSHYQTFLFTAIALSAFAANSVLGRIALGQQYMDASSFTLVRLLSGAIVLTLILRFSKPPAQDSPKPDWLAPAMLFLYAAAFSYAYLILGTGAGALILFGFVQLSIVFISIFSGEKLHGLEWLGLLVSLGGFTYLVLPGASAPSFKGFLLMATAGIAWGIYTLMGRKSQTPLVDTAFNFTWTLPFVFALALYAWMNQEMHVSQTGLLLAFASGGIASGMGYALWYKALSGLSATQAGVVQLLVPVIAALGGVVFVSESISGRLLLSAPLILGGIMLVFWGRYRLFSRKASGPSRSPVEKIAN